MTVQEFADYLNSVKKRDTITSHESDMARDNGLVMVYGASNDLMEIDGSIRDEVVCLNSGIVYLDESGMWVNECENDGCPYAMREQAKCRDILALRHAEGNPYWAYKTDIPHATFNLYDDYDDSELWCVGIVFELSALSDG